MRQPQFAIRNPQFAMLLDSHCHLTNGKLAGRVADILNEARAEGVGAFLTAASSVADSKAAVGLARRGEGVYCAVGVHPHEAEGVGDRYVEQLGEIIASGGDRCVAVGEIGLDYHYDFSPRDQQRRVFDEQLQLAARLGKPVIIHTREATEDALAALAPYAGTLRGVIHSYASGGDEVARFLGQGWYIGFSGIVTFKGAGNVREAAKIVPADRLLIETDAPYLSPVPVRKIFPNVPAHVAHTARFLADLRGVDFDTFAAETTANAAALFGLDIGGD